MFPKMIRIRQRLFVPRIDDVSAAIKDELSRLKLDSRLAPGDTIAVTAGSRGIAQIDLVTRTVITSLKELGASPYIVPAMGSHGGATAQGQLKVLARCGITELTMGVPIRSSMNVVNMGTSPFGFPVYIDKHATEARHIVLINRIRPHTRFSGKIESGLVKMLLVGLGKHQGATLYHQAILEYPFDDIAHCVVPTLLQRLPVVFGLAIIENARAEVAEVKALWPEEFLEREPRLLERSLELMPRIPFREIDLLVVDEMGKDISGTGMDTTIIGKKDNPGVKIKRVFVGDLTDASEGNATGIGLADFTTRRLVDKINFRDTYINCISGLRPEGAKIPITFASDREALEKALQTLGLVEPTRARVIRIKNTEELEELSVSEGYIKELEARQDLQTLSEAEEMAFDSSGNLLPLNLRGESA